MSQRSEDEEPPTLRCRRDHNGGADRPAGDTPMGLHAEAVDQRPFLQAPAIPTSFTHARTFDNTPRPFPPAPIEPFIRSMFGERSWKTPWRKDQEKWRSGSDELHDMLGMTTGFTLMLCCDDRPPKAASHLSRSCRRWFAARIFGGFILEHPEVLVPFRPPLLAHRR